MTIYEIKRIHESKQNNTYFFNPKTMKFFHQTLKSFSVRKTGENEYLISAPMKDHSGKIVGRTERIFNPTTGELKSLPIEAHL